MPRPNVRARTDGAFPTDLLRHLTLRDLRGQYKQSVLGWLWSVLNPLITLVVYSAVFAVFLRQEPSVGDPSGLDRYSFFLLVGLLPWQFHAISLARAAQGLTGNSNLISKIYFPRWVLPTSIVLSSFVTLLIELVVFMVAMALIDQHISFQWIPVLIPLLILQLIFSTGLGLIVSAANVYFRDVQHLLNVIMQPWFFLTPIIYQLNSVPSDRELFGFSYRTLYQLNPMVSFIKAYRNILYDLRVPSLERWAGCGITAFVVFGLGLWVWRRLEPRIAEEI